jgi:GH18 family chitinase
MTDNLPAAQGDSLPVLPELERVCDEVPQMSAEAELVLPIDIYAPWMRSIKSWLEKAGAHNGTDYRASVAMAGFDEKKRALWRVKWKATTDKGVLYLNLMASTLRGLEAEAKQIGHEQNTPENAQNSAENGGKTGI